VDSGTIPAQADLRERLASVNVSPFPAVVSNRYTRPLQKPRPIGDSDEEDRYYFGIDIGPYWFQPLGSCFGLSQAYVERAAMQVIGALWGGSRSDKDARALMGAYRDLETHHSHGSYPRADDLRFYRAYHSMMLVAGELLAKHPIHEDENEPEKEFADWLSRHRLSRGDGKWLADRRDPTPLERPSWEKEDTEVEWRWSTTRSDFDEALFARSGEMSLWGEWTFIEGSRAQCVDVRSAFVSSNRSEALLAALQTANPHRYYLGPSQQSDSEIDHGEFQLRGWIDDSSREARLDENDPWAGGIRCPPICPAQCLVDCMDLQSDLERRYWVVGSEQQNHPVLRSEVWGQYVEQPESSEHERGRRLLGSLDFVVALLHKLDMDLIVQVEMRRRAAYSRYERSKPDDIGYLPPSARLFLLKANGRLCTV
jgi:hypothetical protein